MILQHAPPLHLTYCLNIHPGESWAENFAAIREKALAVKQRVAPEQWFGLGLRIAQQAASELSASADLRAEALDFFNANQLYPFSINGFPYGRFHAGPVKENVYAPDWRTTERLEYTLQLADILAGWLPDQVDGSISTVPCSFKPWIETEDDRRAIVHNLAAVVAYLSALADDTGKELHLGLEPEPDCYLETTEETIRFFKDVLLRDGVGEVDRMLGCGAEKAEALIQRHLGVCFDTCHVAMQFEDVVESLRAYRAAGIRISKVQLSAALRAQTSPAGWDMLKPFVEPVYLHQVKARSAEGKRYAWYDLPDALAELPDFPDVEELNVHFHVPLFFNMDGALQTTSNALTPDFFHEVRCGATAHLEIETYTFDVIPPDLHPGDVVKSIAREYSWTLTQLG
ncbi:MAG TPA: metabolite traffic protein EboE [Chthoniobacteraceae bacterium]|jgi:sugar phosphate isomerase/epimerase|nr:Xylose isomerase domain protein barrel [Chthoniobacter sp.]HEV7868547.1 metabolite traffic protein EboE [Chthoniobacteraceae bacterium]